MKFYIYNENVPLGSESLGSQGKMIIEDLKTLKGAINRAKRSGYTHFRIYTFSNFYDDSTFKEVYKQ